MFLFCHSFSQLCNTSSIILAIYKVFQQINQANFKTQTIFFSLQNYHINVCSTYAFQKLAKYILNIRLRTATLRGQILPCWTRMGFFSVLVSYTKLGNNTWMCYLMHRVSDFLDPQDGRWLTHTLSLSKLVSDCPVPTHPTLSA